MKIKPLDDRVVVKQSQAQEKTSGGIYLPETAKEKPMMGTVSAIGPGRMLENGKLSKMSVKKNDKVLYGKYAGNEIEIDGKTYMILRESDILGIVE